MLRFFNSIKYKLAGFFLIFKMHNDASAQVTANNFDNEISYFRHIDSMQLIPGDPILFIGSSTIKNWPHLDSVFTGYPVLNRGFGGSTLNDIIFYADDVVLKYNPKQIIIYAGENDFASSDSITPQQVFDRFRSLYNIIRVKFPETNVICISLKPSPAKHRMLKKIETYNQLVKDFVSTEYNTAYADIFSAMLAPDGKPNRDLFFDDMTHMNDKGYEVWNSIIKPMLVQ